eukprot:CFRG4544T1
MKLWVGDEMGQLKGVGVEGKVVESRALTQNRENEISFMSWGPGLTEMDRQMQVLCGLRTAGVVNVHSKVGGEVLKTFAAPEGDMVGMSMINGQSADLADYHVMVACATPDANTGVVQYLGWDDATVKYERKFQENLACVRAAEENASVYGAGGKGNNLKIFDIQQKQPIFRAKNLPNDMTDLQVPVWIRDICFVPSTDATKVVVGTGHYEIQYYDTKAKKRPVMHSVVSEHPIMSVAVTHSGDSVIFGTSAGEMKRLDLRSGDIVNSYKGASGSVRCVKCHPTLPYVASCGLDRYTKVHDINSGRLVSKVYMKTRLNTLLFYGEDEKKKEEEKRKGEKRDKRRKNNGDIDSVVNDGEADVWDGLEQVVEAESDEDAGKIETNPKKKQRKSRD